MQLFRPTGRRHPLRLTVWAAGVLLIGIGFCLALPPESLARRSGHERITFAVVGDSIANELGQGMQSLYRRSSRVRVLKKTKFSTGTAASWRGSPSRGCGPMRPGWRVS